MTNKEQAAVYLKLIESEVPATRKCLERIEEKVFTYRPPSEIDGDVIFGATGG